MAHEVVGEHIILTGEHLTENATGEVETIFDGKVHLPVVKRDMRHYVHDSLNRLRIVTFSKMLLSSEIICLYLFMRKPPVTHVIETRA